VRVFALTGALLAWFAIITQFYLIMSNRVVPAPDTIFRFFSFFTVDTNIIVAFCFTFIFLRKNTRLSHFFYKTSTITAITVYITIVGIVYNIILRSLWKPEGMQKIVDELLHSVIPGFFILFWLLFAQTRELKWANALPWLIYPIIYMKWSVIHGAITEFYPYPFVDVNKLGYGKALLNAIGILVLIFLLSLILIALNRTRPGLKDKVIN
jgi:hypothetical protein